jgi:hypothetical protein
LIVHRRPLSAILQLRNPCTPIAEFRDFVILGFLIEDSECHFPQFHNHTIPKSRNPSTCWILEFSYLGFPIMIALGSTSQSYNSQIPKFRNPEILQSSTAGFWNFLFGIF